MSGKAHHEARFPGGAAKAGARLGRREWLALAIGSAATGCSAGWARLDTDAPRRRALARGTEFLRRAQRADGSWRSSTYGLLAGGDSLTAFVAQAIAETDPRAEAVRRALGYLVPRIGADGGLGTADPGLPDYPNYSSALCLRALLAARPPGWKGAADRLTAHLLSRQFQERDGWAFDSAPYGGWGMGGAVRRPPEPGHVDLSMTRHVLEALAHAGLRRDHPALVRARVFVERCKNEDGGFHFSTAVAEANKAGRRDGRWLSYGTATADGIRACRALGMEVERSIGWLREHHRPRTVSGFDEHPDTRWKDGLWFYYVAGASPFLEPTQRLLLQQVLGERQSPDGSWRNAEPLVKEDDPLIATACAVRALSAPRS